MIELDLCFGLLLLILFGLLSLRNGHVSLAHIRFICQCWLVMITPLEVQDFALCILTVVLLQSFHSFEALLFLLLAYIGQLYMMHSCNLVSFYVCLEAQTLCVVVLCGLLARGASTSFSVEAALKFLLLSAMVSGMALFWFSAMYQRTGSLDMVGQETFWILLVMLFKLGVAPMHMWSVDLYGSIPKSLLLYLSTAPKLSLFTFWASSWHHDFSVGVFILFSMFIGSIGAYGQPALRSLFAYSTINEIGLLLLAVETAGFHTLYQHLGIYIITQLLLWNLTDKRLFALCAVSLAGLPPFAGFFGKAWIFWHAMSVQAFSLLAAALFCTLLSLVYYLRVIRLFWTAPVHTAASFTGAPNQTTLTSACAVALAFAPVMLVKPFVI
jgi:NADH:ubiquinone oxidoreductase subunit 2 (subunit N)|uniref:NADH-ubiquinone oxidoreductase chain 2 n=2 Tax=Chlamydomonas reinhardtii TaxID=3055 RepID=NU2M_CHLRE|nr:NADH dehydrogenase subunit 2 [Chlamydomonas reinhardtii]P08740.1 RecName: Full=NADH-ubiquinone oxidoreductase chain 2; AltName: Full=NADH dehydrogenase subunit 2 [Chlamydomonas reinhardtii]AAB93444.1 NADH dehydrogenase subunit 2 [Chlamydomonas reinhardtii]ABX82065.1 NADH dehydrogenase subunit 2 [Chlamydomonas reinhardtii]ABX82073.1 NADH dehydrogenase subunit 2 [Chlamydomonas reinhardtii]ABX82081.1 NADH dehydrogenase subunit 2 [Chlamydomonas reinhardtii]ABX82089.1 NADH dehydrogenase subunit|eukprot:NP_042568.1 NADH dehydrogenase subunit 2 (mitochondrion) [Chlamydomonas reinhardtii]